MRSSSSVNWQHHSQIKLFRPIAIKSTCIQGGFLTSVSHNSVFIQAKDITQKNSKSLLKIEVLYAPGDCFIFRGKVTVLPGGEIQLVVAEKDQSLFSTFLTKVRKDQHISLCETRDVESVDKLTGFESVSFRNNSLPELNMSEIETSVQFLGRQCSLPVMIVGMTGGLSKGQEINERLAAVASEFTIPMGVGSQRIAIENSAYSSIFKLKNKFPNLFLVGNLGFSDLLLMTNPIDACQRAIDMIEADALAIHVNVLQECLQVEGNLHFKGAFSLLEKICKHCQVPILVKEVGGGMLPSVGLRLEEVGVSAIDIGGKGGTSWSYIEGLRCLSKEFHEVAVSFRDWGVPTAYNLAAYKKKGVSIPLIATGGIRDGQTVAKACGMGASLSGIGLPFLRAALKSEDELRSQLTIIKRQLMITMMITGSRSLGELNQSICYGLPCEEEFNDYFRTLSLKE